MSSWYSSAPTMKPFDRLLLTYPTLEQMMAEVDLVAQLKAFNSKLLEYLTNTPDLVRQLIELLVQPPKETDSPERKFKYPLMAVEVVETQAICVLNGFFKECTAVPQYRTNLDYLYSLLEQRQPLLLSAGYFFRVNNCLLNLKFKQLVEWVYQRQDTFRRLLQHSTMVTLTNTVQVLLSLDASKAGVYIEERKNMKVETIVAVIAKLQADSYDPMGDSVQNLTNILVEVVEKYYLIADGKFMLEPVLTMNTIEQLVEMALGSNPFTALPAMTLLISIINHYSFSSMNNEDKDSHEATLKNIERIDSQPVVQVLCRNFERFTSVLDHASKINLVQYKTLELLCHSVSLSSNSILSAIKRTKYLELLLELLFRHENSNITHMLIERTFLHLFVNEKKFYDQYKFYSFCGMNIIARTAGRISNEKFQQLKGKGYFGHLMRIIKIYSSIQTTDEKIIRVIRENSDLWAKVTKEVIKLHEDISFKALGTYDLPNYNPVTIEFKIKQTSGTMMPHPRPRNDVLENINDEYSSWSKTTSPASTPAPDSIMQEKDSLFKQPLEEITSANHLFEKASRKDVSSPIHVKTTSLTDTSSPILDRKLEEQIRHQRANSPRNESFQEFIEKKKLEAQEQIKLQRTLSQEKKYGPRSPSPNQRRVNCWAEDQDDLSGKTSPNSKKAISKSMIVPGQQQHDRNRKDIPRVKVMMLDKLPTDKRYRKVDSSDVQFLTFLGLQLPK